MGWFSKDKLPPRRSRMEMVQDYLPQAKPFTGALMLRASQRGDEAYDDLKKMVGKVKYQEDDHTFEDFVASTAVSTALEISRLGAKNIGVKTNYMPGFEIPREAPYVVAFSACALHLLNQYLTTDDVKIDFSNAIIDVSKLHYMFHENQEASEMALEGIKIYEHIRDYKSSKDIKTWRDALSEMAYMYVIQWTSDNVDFKRVDYVPLFGKALKMLINAGLHGVMTAQDIQPTSEAK